jgi:hypothetical protein
MPDTRGFVYNRRPHGGAPSAEPFWLEVAILAGGFTLRSFVDMRWVPLAKEGGPAT